MTSKLAEQSVGKVGVLPQKLYLMTDLTYNEITQPGYIQAVAESQAIGLTTSFTVEITYNNGSGGTLTNIFIPTVSDGVITLGYAGAPAGTGAVLLDPGHDQTIVSGKLYVENVLSAGGINVNAIYDLPDDAGDEGDVITWSGTNAIWAPGGGSDAAVLLNPTGFQEITGYQLQVDKGIQVGDGTTVGQVDFFSGDNGTAFAWRGAPNESILYSGIFTNEAFGQNTTVSVPDPETSTAKFMLGTGTLTAGNLTKFSTVTGLIEDTGIAASSVGTGSVTSVGSGTGLTGGPITGSGTISFAPITDGTLLANISGISAAPVGVTASALLDDSFSSTQGAVLYRGAAGWAALGPGTSGDVFTTNGTAADPSWETPSGGGTNQTSIALSPSVFTYFNCIITGAIIWLSSSAPNTQGAFTAGASNDYGTFTFKAAAGTYNVGIIYTEGTGNGIMRIIINGGSPVDIDQYGTNINQYRSYQFSTTLLEGDNTINVLTNGKNGSAGNYYLNFAGDIVLNYTGP